MKTKKMFVLSDRALNALSTYRKVLLDNGYRMSNSAVIELVLISVLEGKQDIDKDKIMKVLP